ncbi:hypothetical protein SNE40_009968 [Patella caerulea]|uniref:BED-type domain-containing protein n=1 Tax=Patella caerulea TaxID=87958 RepID=A0AAN8JV26_PATCE
MSGSITAALGDLEIEKPPAQYKSKVWEYFGFPVTYRNGNRKVNRDVSVCRSCHAQIRYTGNTTNMSTHISRHHALYLNQHTRPSACTTTPSSSSRPTRPSSADSNPTNSNTSSPVNSQNTSNLTFVSLVETNEGTGQKKKKKK